jgi:hypothetical protein
VKRPFEHRIWAFSLLAPLACGGSGKPAVTQSESNPLLAAAAAPAALMASGADALSAALAASVQQGDAPGVAEPLSALQTRGPNGN